MGAGQQVSGEGPLAGIRVVEFAGIGPVPYGAMLLADLGAEILTIARADAPWPQLPIVSRGRSTLVLDLKSSGDLNIAREAVIHADILVEGFRPGVMERLKLGSDDLLALNPALIYTRVTGWGQHGPLSKSAGHDINYIALCGMLGLLGRDETPPDAPLNWLGDYAAGSLFMVMGILAALFERSRSGLGQMIDVAIVDGGASLLAPILGMARAGLLPAEPGRNLLAGRAPFYRTYRCLDDRDLAVGPLEPAFRAQLARGLGIEPELLDGDPQIASQRLKTIFRSQPRDHWVKLFEGSDACITPILSLEETAEHPHLVERQTFRQGSSGIEPAPAPRFSRTPGQCPLSRSPEELLRSWRASKPLSVPED